MKQYVKNYLKIADHLHKKKRAAGVELVRFFMKGIPKHLWKKLFVKKGTTLTDPNSWTYDLLLELVKLVIEIVD